VAACTALSLARRVCEWLWPRALPCRWRGACASGCGRVHCAVAGRSRHS